MGLPKPAKRYTPEEYYRLEREASYKSDYYAGEIFAMAGGTITHSTICSNLVRELGNQLKGKPCAAFESNLRLKVKATGLRTYPDASVYCQPYERDHEDPAGETLTNPVVLIEVLSPSTERYDRDTKARNYRQVESLQAYVLISQDDPRAEVFERQPDGTWSLRDVTGLNESIRLGALGLELPLAEVYDRVDFPANQTPQV
jgi:Uma2 family endonuclease